MPNTLMRNVQWVPGEVTLIFSGEEFKALSCALEFQPLNPKLVRMCSGCRGR